MAEDEKTSRRRTEHAISFLKKKVQDQEGMAIKNQHIFANIPPDVILGFRVGTHLDFQVYQDLGFEHPKAGANGEYYKLGGTHRKRAEFAAIYDGIKRRMAIDSPVIIWVYEDREILVLDGATRLSVIGQLKHEFPDAFKLVPVQLFTGSRDAALTEMTRRNLPNRSRDLTTEEMMRQVVAHAQNGMPRTRIAEMLGFSDSTGPAQVDMLLQLNEKGSRRVLDALFHGQISLRTAADVARRTDKLQDDFINNVLSQKDTVTPADVEKNLKPIQEPNVVNISAMTLKFNRALKVLTDTQEKICEAAHLDDKGELMARWNEFTKTMTKVSEKLAEIERKFSSSSQTVSSAPKVDDCIIDESDIPCDRIGLAEWIERFKPIANDEVESQFDAVPQQIRNFAVSVDITKPVPDEVVWSVIHDGDHYWVEFGRSKEDGVVANVVCAVPNDGLRKFEVYVDDQSVDDGGAFDGDSSSPAVPVEEEGFGEDGKMPGEKKTWSPPKNVNRLVKDTLLGKWAEDQTQPHHPTEILAAMESTTSGRKSLDRILMSDAPKERVRRLGKVLTLWNQEKAFEKYQILVLKPKEGEKGPRFSVKKVGRKA